MVEVLVVVLGVVLIGLTFRLFRTGAPHRLLDWLDAGQSNELKEEEQEWVRDAARKEMEEIAHYDDERREALVVEIES